MAGNNKIFISMSIRRIMVVPFIFFSIEGDEIGELVASYPISTTKKKRVPSSPEEPTVVCQTKCDVRISKMAKHWRQQSVNY